MALHNEFGHNAESLAAQFLSDRGYEIVEKNWRVSRLEADIIAVKDEFLIIVEVKARNFMYVSFEEIVSLKKQKNLIDLAEKYLEKNDLDYEVRFDVILVDKKNERTEIKHIENAFYSTL